MGLLTKENLNVFASITVNFFSSIAIIQINKYIYVKYKFPNMSLTCLHFIVSFIGLLVCSLFGIFKIVRVPLTKMIPMSISFCGFVALTNYSLQFNSIGTYQCLKSLTIPGVMLISIYYYKHTYSTRVKISVIPVLLGVVFNSIYDLRFSFIGLMFGLSAAFVTSLYQVWIGEKQKELKINALQLLFYQSPLSAIFLLLIIPFFEPLHGKNSPLNFNRPINEWYVILSSGLIAFFVNVSIYWIIGITSALTYNMSGNLKFCVTIIIGCMLFEDPINLQQVASITMVLMGLVSYSYYRITETKKESTAEDKNITTETQNLIDIEKQEESRNENNDQNKN